jgi:hypothetical protein
MERFPGSGATPPDASDPLDTLGGAELLEDRTTRISGGQAGRRVGASVPGVVAAAFLVGAIAFGANVVPGAPVSSTSEDGTSTAASTAPDANGGSGGTASADDQVLGRAGGPGAPVGTSRAGSDGGPVDVVVIDEPTAKPTERPTGEPKPDATKPDATERPIPEKLRIAAEVGEGGVIVKWSACDPVGFAYYKLVRSLDERVTWPMGDDDRLVGAFDDPAITRTVDKRAPAGTKVFYAVFALSEIAPRIACASGVASVVTPRPDPTPKPTDKPVAIELAVALKEGKVFLDWSSCERLDFDHYKVVRSKDERVTFPAGDGDTVIAAVGRDGRTAAWDESAPAGKTLYYRVFCVRATDAGYRVLAASPTKKIATPPADPKPTPVPEVMAFEVSVTGEGVALQWEACTSDGFRAYKVIRKTSAGSKVIAEFESQARTSFVDSAVEAGGTYTYQVLGIGYRGETKVTLCATRLASVTVD